MHIACGNVPWAWPPVCTSQSLAARLSEFPYIVITIVQGVGKVPMPAASCCSVAGPAVAAAAGVAAAAAAAGIAGALAPVTEATVLAAASPANAAYAAGAGVPVAAAAAAALSHAQAARVRTYAQALAWSHVRRLLPEAKAVMEARDEAVWEDIAERFEIAVASIPPAPVGNAAAAAAAEVYEGGAAALGCSHSAGMLAAASGAGTSSMGSVGAFAAV